MPKEGERDWTGNTWKVFPSVGLFPLPFPEKEQMQTVTKLWDINQSRTTWAHFKAHMCICYLGLIELIRMC